VTYLNLTEDLFEYVNCTDGYMHSSPWACLSVDARSALLPLLRGYIDDSARVVPKLSTDARSLYTIFWHLSTYALHLHLSLLYPHYPLPSMQLPSLPAHALFPHQIKALKCHIVRQSELFLTKAHAHQAAEAGWRAAADDMTHEYRTLQRQWTELNAITSHVAANTSRIPPPSDPEREREHIIYSPQAHDEVSTAGCWQRARPRCV
jgi:hypothetical protein